MARNIFVEAVNTPTPDKMAVELVERKGTGHPDYIADAASEEASLQLSRYYIKRYGRILHHNLDKTLLVGGQSSPVFGGGELTQPIYIIVSGRATTEVSTEGGIETIPVGPLVIRAVKRWIKENLRYLDPEEHVVVDYRIGKGSVDLRGVFEEGKKTPLANDTSFGAGFYPLTVLEKLVYETERYLNSEEFKKRYPELGEDIKVMGLRKGKTIELTIAGAFISILLDDADHYMSVKNEIVERVKDRVSRLAPDHEVKIFMNTADIPERGIFYLTVTGTSAEHGDDGATGRGNRVNGLITPLRTMSLEAAAGKNPVNHVGKIYNVVANMASKRIYEETGEEFPVTVHILSQIGKPIDEPFVASVKLVSNEREVPSHVMETARAIMDEELSNIARYTDYILEKKASLF